MILVTTANADLDLTTNPAALTQTLQTYGAANAFILVELGDGVNDLAGNGGSTITISVTAGGVPLGLPFLFLPETGQTRARVLIPNKIILSGEEVIVKVESDDVADTNVDTTVSIYAANRADFDQGTNVYSTLFNGTAVYPLTWFDTPPLTNVQEDTPQGTFQVESGYLRMNTSGPSESKGFQFDIALAAIGKIYMPMSQPNGAPAVEQSVTLFVNGVARHQLICNQLPTFASGNTVNLEAALSPGVNTIRIQADAGPEWGAGFWAPAFTIATGYQDPITYELGTQLLGEIQTEVEKIPRVGNTHRHTRQDANADNSKVVDVLISDAL